MQIKRIKCPSCGVVLDVKNSKNEILKQITCPRCMALLQIKFAPQQGPIEAPTYYVPSGKPAIDGETQLAPSLKSKNPKEKGYLLYEGNRYMLIDGKNIIGRKGKTSEATIQIDSQDRYMSRQHICITASSTEDGKQKFILSNYQNKNATTIDGQPIEIGDEIRLVDGNRITMGQTTVVFKLS